MEKYKNLSGTTGVVAYETADNSITVKFQGGGTYLYTYQSAGQSNVEQMKELAASGKGLSTFIVRNVRNSYAMKLR
ncbi:MAG: hypothetical protein WD037_07255 [Balneolales bacterium]